MNHHDEWLDELYHSHITYLTYYAQKYANGNQYILQEIPDILQQVFILLYEKKEILIHHPNIVGWLTITTKRIIYDMIRRMKSRGYSSIDEEKTRMQWEAEGARRAAMLDLSLRQISDQLSQIEEQIGQNNLIILTSYYDPNIDASDLARKLQLSEAALRKKVNLLCRKLQKTLSAMLILCLVSQMVCFFTFI